MIIELAGYRCHNCGREFMLREPIPRDCAAAAYWPAGNGAKHVVDYVMLKRELPYD